jgi:uncharacterized membrane protein YhhN
MTEPQTHETTSAPPSVPPRPTLLDVARSQRKVIGVGIVLMLACFWFIGQIGEWRTATLTAAGILLAVLNHLAGEYWLGKVISSGDEPTRGSMAASAFTRLAVLSVVAVGLAALFWPNGVGLLLGLAVFRLIALVMTGIPLLKELKKA